MVFLWTSQKKSRKQICGEEILRQVDMRASQPDFDYIGPRGIGTGLGRKVQPILEAVRDIKVTQRVPRTL